MPVPFALIFAAAAGGVGAAKSVKAALDQDDANNTNENAQKIIDDTTNKINRYRKNCGDAVNHLGQEKVWVANGSIKKFIHIFEKLHEIDYKESTGLNELNKMRIDNQSIQELRSTSDLASSLIGGMAGGAVTGAVTAFGAYGAASIFGVASTNVAIASLSGAAASNATLAFLGGGALTAGGLGVAGGVAALGGLVAGPALAIMGFVVGAKASANKDVAYTNLAQAKEYRAEMNTACAVCMGIRMQAAMLTRLLIRLEGIINPLIVQTEKIIAKNGTDYKTYPTNDKHTVAALYSVASAIKTIIDTPLLTEDGKLTSESIDVANRMNSFVDKASAIQN